MSPNVQEALGNWRSSVSGTKESQLKPTCQTALLDHLRYPVGQAKPSHCHTVQKPRQEGSRWLLVRQCWAVYNDLIGMNLTLYLTCMWPGPPLITCSLLCSAKCSLGHALPIPEMSSPKLSKSHSSKPKSNPASPGVFPKNFSPE